MKAIKIIKGLVWYYFQDLNDIEEISNKVDLGSFLSSWVEWIH